MFSMMSPDEVEQLVEYVSELLAMAGMAMYTHSPMPEEHRHADILGNLVCIHEYFAANGRIVRLFCNHGTPRTLTMSVTVGPDEPVLSAPQIDYKESHDAAVIDTLESILALPDAEDPLA